MTFYHAEVSRPLPAWLKFHKDNPKFDEWKNSFYAREGETYFEIAYGVYTNGGEVPQDAVRSFQMWVLEGRSLRIWGNGLARLSRGDTMKQVIPTERIPIKLWLDHIEETALAQAKRAANFPFAYKWIAIMPDAHAGYGIPVGGVMATSGVVIPYCVGVDIGCGMVAVKTSLTDISTDALKQTMSLIRKTVPVGFKHNRRAQLWPGFDEAPDIQIIQEQLTRSRKQLGTLGGGNHFIEIQKGSDGHVWLMIHSGSRNFGLQIANTYHKKAVALCERWASDIPHKDLSFLPMDEKVGHEYLTAMNYALRFAKANRALMMERSKLALATVMDLYDDDFEEVANIHHNYAATENHYGKNVLVHRKGATKATVDTVGIIPGSMGTPSYIVQGLSNPESFNSCSHGAGRTMGRKQAKRILSLEEEQAKMAGVVGGIRGVNDLDEAPGAYKDIATVMDNQRDLVDVLVELHPIANMKG
jgi:tRNA-splicing ligase RtcB